MCIKKMVISVVSLRIQVAGEQCKVTGEYFESPKNFPGKAYSQLSGHTSANHPIFYTSPVSFAGLKTASVYIRPFMYLLFI